MLKIRDLSLHKKRQILQAISLNIPKGRMTLLIGKSGSGKTSLLRSIGQIEKGYEGEIKYEGVSLAEMSVKDRSALIGFVSQSFALFPHLNVWENCLQPLNIHFGKKKGLYEEVEKILTSLGMEKHLKSRVHELSGGQQQRVAIARALLLNPSFLLLDEPTSALDPENTEILRKMIQTLLKEEKGIVISTQDMTFAESILDRAFFLEEGALVESYDRYNGMKGPKLERFFS